MLNQLRIHVRMPMASHFCETAAAAAKSLQSCLTLCDPIDGSPPGPSFSGILLTPCKQGQWALTVFISRVPTDTHASEPSGKEDNPPEDENTGCDQRVCQKCPNGHHVHEGLQVEEERHHSCWGKERRGKKSACEKIPHSWCQVRDKGWEIFLF